MKSNNKVGPNSPACTKTICHIFLISGWTFILTGCFSAGRDFGRPPVDNFELGKTTLSQIVQSVGQPTQVETTEKNGKVITEYFYHYSAAAIFPIQGVTAVGRKASFYFSNDVLVGYLYESSYLGDSTDFDERKVALLVKGKSTRQDIETLLGKPSGVMIYPLADGPQDTILGYYHIGMTALLKIVSKKALITVDQSGVVSDIKLGVQEKYRN